MNSSTSSRITVKCACGKKYKCSSTRIGKTVTCRSCGQQVVIPETTAPSDTVVLANSSLAEESPSPGSSPFRSVAMTFGWLFLATVTGFAFHFVPMQFNGPKFMGFYVAAFAGCAVACELFRARESHFFGVPLLVFISIGFARILYGLQHEMTKFELLIVAMIVGTILMALGTRRIFSDVPDRWLWAATPVVAFPFGILLIFVSTAGLSAVPAFALILFAVIMDNSRGGGGCGGAGGCGG